MDSMPRMWAGRLPREAMDLLRRSLADSCRICAEGHRRDAFELLEEFYYPGLRLQGLDQPLFVRLPGSDNEITLTSPETAGASLTFRLHSWESRLIGIADKDLTDPAILGKLDALPSGQPFRAELEIVPYPYGDGAAFLFSPAQGRLQVQCKVLRVEN